MLSLHFLQSFNFDAIKAHQVFLVAWTHQHYFLAVCAYMLLYTVVAFISMPGTQFLAMSGGFLFGVWPGVLYALISATLGSATLFSVVKKAFSGWIEKKSSNWIQKAKQGFQNNAFYYVLVLRFIPLFPFWLVNVTPALLRIRLRTFMGATFIGLIPSLFVYTSLGRNLDVLFNGQQALTVGMILQPTILVPLIALVILTLFPVMYKSLKGT